MLSWSEEVHMKNYPLTYMQVALMLREYVLLLGSSMSYTCMYEMLSAVIAIVIMNIQ